MPWALQIDAPFRSFQRFRVKSGMAMGALPAASDASLKGPGALHAAASYTSFTKDSGLGLTRRNVRLTGRSGLIAEWIAKTSPSHDNLN